MKGLDQILIYYFSGTGNAAAVSEWIQDECRKSEIGCELRNLASIDRRKIPPVNKQTLTGFVAPTHGFNFPPVMFHFLLRFPRGKGNKVFLMNTRAGMKLGKIFMPGLSGMALYFSALILLVKGYKITALKSVDLPSNWISLHPGLRKKVVESIILKRKEETKAFARILIAGKRIMRGLLPLPLDIAITPVAVLYYFIGRFFLAKTFIASSKCTSCGLCDQSCPVNAIKIVDGRRFWSWSCESCMKCMNNCPERAIETAHGFVAIIILVLDGIIVSELNRIADLRSILFDILPPFIAGFTHFAIINFILVILIFLSYRILHFLLRYSFFERIFVLTSLSHYKFWRRYRPSWKKFR